MFKVMFYLLRLFFFLITIFLPGNILFTSAGVPQMFLVQEQFFEELLIGSFTPQFVWI